jgi:GNAT superfamily N-acetyltransferase
MEAERIAIRRARPIELDAIVGIDDEASVLYADAGIAIDLDPEHPFVRAERARLERAISMGQLEVAALPDDSLVGFVSSGLVDGEPYVDQLSVRPGFMRRGIGARLLRTSIAWAETTGAHALWLTTYAHVPWNRAYYERAGFRVWDERRCGPAMRAILSDQRAVLPDPDERIVMARPIASGRS